MEQQPGKLVPALIGGGVMAILSTVPLVNLGNCFCCMWLLLGGALAVWFYQKDLPPGAPPLSAGDGALLGLLAGAFGALFSTLLNTLMTALGGALPMARVLENLQEYRSDIAPEVEELFRGLGEAGFLSPLFIFAGLFFSLIIDGVFGLIGGLIGVSLFKKKTPPSSEQQDNADSL